MGFDFDELKKDFDALKAAKDLKEEQCEIACEDEEDQGFIELVQKWILAPVKCGVYLSRLDIKVIGLKFGEDVQVRERKRMLRDILRAVTSKEELRELFDIINEAAEEKIAVYQELMEHFPHSKVVFEDKIAKYEDFKKVQRKIIEDFEEIEER